MIDRHRVRRRIRVSTRSSAREQEEDDAISVCSSMFSETADPHKKVLRDKVHKFFKYHDKKPTSCNRAKTR